MDIIPYSSILIDVSPSQYFTLLGNFFKRHNRDDCQRILEDAFLRDKQKESLIVSLSVRTAFDLFLEAVKFPVGTEIVMTGINIPDMTRVAREHGFLPVPVNIDPDYLAPDLKELEEAITPQTKAIMVSYIYGVTYNIDEIIKLAKKHNLYILEDIAEAFHSTENNGHPEADLSLFSFGTIKHNTALAGAITIVRNNDVLTRKMNNIQDSYPQHPDSTYFKKILKTSMPAVMLNSTFINGNGKVVCRALNFEYKEYTVGLVRGFPKEGDFLPKFQYKVSNVLMANLAFRFKTFDNAKFKEHIKKIKDGQDILVKGGVQVLGYKAEDRSFWLFPIAVPDIPLCYKMLNDRGVDAYLGATQLRVIEAPEGSKYKSLEKTQEWFDKILYLPIGTNVPADAIEKICHRTVEVINLVQNMKQNPMPKL